MKHPARSRIVAASALLPLLVALGACSSGDEGPDADASSSTTASAPATDAPATDAPGAAEEGIARYRTLVESTFAPNHDLDDQAERWANTDVDDAAVMVRRLDARAEQEGLSFSVGAVDPDRLSDITCYLGRRDLEGLWLDVASQGADSVRLALGEGEQCGSLSAAAYVLVLSVVDGDVTVETSAADPAQADAATALGAAVQELVRSVLPPTPSPAA